MVKEKEEIKEEKKVNLDTAVNSVKLERAKKAVYGGAKPDTAEIRLVQTLKGQGLKDDKLVMEVYKGLGGLVDLAKAKKNRENEAKEKAKKASR